MTYTFSSAVGDSTYKVRRVKRYDLEPPFSPFLRRIPSSMP
jgi:hypothetical protein